MLVRSMRKSNDAAHAKTGQHVRDLRGEVQALDAKNEAAHAGIVERIDTSLYKAGAGVPHDDLEAVRWFRLAADQGRVLLFVLFAVVPLASVSARLQPPAPPAGTSSVPVPELALSQLRYLCESLPTVGILPTHDNIFRFAALFAADGDLSAGVTDELLASLESAGEIPPFCLEATPVPGWFYILLSVLAVFPLAVVLYAALPSRFRRVSFPHDLVLLARRSAGSWALPLVRVLPVFVVLATAAFLSSLLGVLLAFRLAGPAAHSASSGVSPCPRYEYRDAGIPTGFYRIEACSNTIDFCTSAGCRGLDTGLP